MRKEFVEVPSEAAAIYHCPWASVIVPVFGGFWCFESVEDYDQWLAQV